MEIDLDVLSSIVVMDLRPIGKVERKTARLVSSAILAGFDPFYGLETYSQDDLEFYLTNRQRRAVRRRCRSADCLARIGRRLGVDAIAFGTIGRLGSERYAVNISVVQSATGWVVGRTTRTIVTGAGEKAILGELLSVAPFLVAKFFSTGHS